jgi:hypothetical protein
VDDTLQHFGELVGGQRDGATVPMGVRAQYTGPSISRSQIPAPVENLHALARNFRRSPLPEPKRFLLSIANQESRDAPSPWPGWGQRSIGRQALELLAEVHDGFKRPLGVFGGIAKCLISQQMPPFHAFVLRIAWIPGVRGSHRSQEHGWMQERRESREIAVCSWGQLGEVGFFEQEVFVLEFATIDSSILRLGIRPTCQQEGNAISDANARRGQLLIFHGLEIDAFR